MDIFKEFTHHKKVINVVVLDENLILNSSGDRHTI